ncbi:MAG: hypothetical protein KBS74_01275 [Clostridiales bacterium]|nr:hypothetical protein [Candidatus Cacconaster stercorequi]
MAYYRTCPYCGAHLDPGEQCDCRSGWETAGFLLLVSLALAADGLLEALSIVPALCVAAVTLSASWACHLMAERKAACTARKSLVQAAHRTNHKRGTAHKAYHPSTEKARRKIA